MQDIAMYQEHDTYIKCHTHLSMKKSFDSCIHGVISFHFQQATSFIMHSHHRVSHTVPSFLKFIQIQNACTLFYHKIS